MFVLNNKQMFESAIYTEKEKPVDFFMSHSKWVKESVPKSIQSSMEQI